jgi:hypothetical protein
MIAKARWPCTTLTLIFSRGGACNAAVNVAEGSSNASAASTFGLRKCGWAKSLRISPDNSSDQVTTRHRCNLRLLLKLVGVDDLGLAARKVTHQLDHMLRTARAVALLAIPECHE